MLKNNSMYPAFFLLLILTFSDSALAGTFTPENGDVIDTQDVTINWSSDAPQQWVRAYNHDNGTKLYDSGRLFDASGQLTFSLPAQLTSLRVIFYERVSGSWSPQERVYTVRYDNNQGSEGASLASLSCTTDEIARYDGNQWLCSTDREFDPLSEAGCAPGEFLRATTNAEWECVSGVIELEETCPSGYLEHLRGVEVYNEPGFDGVAGLISLSKNIEELHFPNGVSDTCVVEWGFHLESPNSISVKHTFREYNWADGGDGGIEFDFDTFVLNRSGGQEIEVEYIGERDPLDNPNPNRQSTFFFPVSADQWEACGRLAGCDFPSLY